MPKRVTIRYEPLIVLDTTSSVPLYRQLYDRLRLVLPLDMVDNSTSPGERI